MDILKRISNVWKLSAYEPGEATDETKTPGTEVAMIVKKPQKKAEFIPYKKVDPIKELINESPV